jgi:hypothetical protein
MIAYTIANYKKRFLHYLLLNSSFNDKIGLLDGKAAAILYSYYAGFSLNDEWSNSIGFSFLEETFSQINMYTPLTYGSGITGIGVLLEHITQQNFLEQNTNELLEESEPYLLSTIYGAKLQEAGIASGVSGVGLYFLHRLGAVIPAHPFQQLRFKECVIACVDQIYQMINKPNVSALERPGITIWNGLSGILLFLNRVYNLHWYEPFVSELAQRISSMLYQQLKTSGFSWQQAEAWFSLLHCGLLNKVITEEEIGYTLDDYLLQAEKNMDKIDFYEAAFTTLWLKLIFYKTKQSSALLLSDQIKDDTLQVLAQNRLGDLFPFNIQERSVSVGLNRGVCGTALPLLSMEINDYRWLDILGIDVKCA